MARILVVDNYDSFVFNLVQYLGQLGADTVVLRNDEVTTDDTDGFDGVLLSPGPGRPEDAGVSVAMVRHDGEGVFAGLPQDFAAVRYHSLGAVALGADLVATAWGGGVLMAMEHRELPAVGVQFHPESVLTPDGKAMLEAFLA